MLLEIIVIVLRETLEASILVGVLLSASNHFGVRFSWFPVALFAGLVGAFAYGAAMGDISEWFDYAGQEVVNASMQLFIYALVATMIPLQWLNVMSQRRVLCYLMTAIVCVAIAREGSELYIFYSGFLLKEDVLLKALTSGFVGLAAGLSVGAIVYYALTMMRSSRVIYFHTMVLGLVAAGMVMQATQLLIQADWISAGTPLWDSSTLIAESSIAGQVAYAIFGYEAAPSFTEIAAYSLSVLGLILIALFTTQICRKKRAIP